MKIGIKQLFFRILDFILFPFSIPIAFLTYKLRANCFIDFPLTKRAFFWIGVYPINDHYYEPLFNTKHLKKSLRLDRNLPGINFNDKEQLELLEHFNYNEELLKIPQYPNQKKQKQEFCYNEGPFNSGDAEYLYNIIRYYQPKRIIEIGSGYSTLMANNAVKMNKIKYVDYNCKHYCIEPFENKWLEELNIEIVREKVEDLDNSYFDQLQENDILFIDSSHMIRPQGDVLYEYLELLPQLNKGVVVHIHDIFTPKDYLNEWLEKDGRFWNEQYLLEAFLSQNHEYRIIGATNYLMHKYFAEFSEKCPVLKTQIEKGLTREPGSFWMIKN